MADPRVRYDIEANVQGWQGVEFPAKSLENLDRSIDPALAARLKDIADELRVAPRERG